MGLRGDRGRRMEQGDQQQQQQLTGALWLRLQEQLIQREIQCSLSNTTSSTTNHNSNQTWNLLKAVRDYRDTHKENDIHCAVPSSCPLSMAETKVAAVLVINDHDDDNKHTLDWRQVLVACLKLLPSVAEVWVLISENVWSTLEDDKNNEIYRQRFRQWQRQSNTRIHPMIVAEKDRSWIETVQQLNGETMATTIIWAEWNNLPTETSWQTFVQRRVEKWRKMPMPLHISHHLRLSTEATHNYGDPKDHATSPLSPNYCLPAELRNAIKGKSLSIQLETVVRSTFQTKSRFFLPSIHGAVHDRAWLCYWAHPILARLLGQNDWNVVGLGAALWMAHLGGTQDISVEENGTTTATTTEAVIQVSGETVDFFGGASLPGNNNVTASQPCAT
eukprot:scaffold142_cov155-Amphora_coffeaeformis.AAC.6